MTDLLLPIPPVLPPQKLRRHGVSWQDPFFRFRSPQYRPKLMRYLNAENRYYKKQTADYLPLIKTLSAEIKQRVPEKDASVPVRIGDYFYYSRTEKGKNYPIHCRKNHTLEAPEEVTLDVNDLAKGKACCMFSGMSISANHRYLAFGINFDGGISYQIKIKDLLTNTFLNEHFSKTDGDMVWGEDHEHLFYTKQAPKSLRSYCVMRHKLGTSVTEDVVVFEEKDTLFSCGVWKSKSDAFIFIETASSDSNEHYFLDAKTPCESFQLFSPREEKVEYNPIHVGDSFFIHTNASGATAYKVMRTPLNQTHRSHWIEQIIHDENAILEEVEETETHLIILVRAQAQFTLRVYAITSHELPFVCEKTFSSIPHTLNFTGNPNLKTDSIRLSYASLVEPHQVFQWSFFNDEIKILKTQKVKHYDESEYDSKRIWITMEDGFKIPVSMLWKKELFSTTQPNCMLLRGYGAYSCSAEASFRPSVISLLDRGMVCAFAHVRGGGELGQKGYDGGRLFNKKNSFTDFIACADFFIKNGITSHEKLVISGASAGGLLIGAVLNERPNLCHAAMLEVPFVDVLCTMLDPTLPLTTGEYPEWGDPRKKEDFLYIKSYSPYENLKLCNYPILCVTSSLNDEQVSFTEAAKYVAKLRTMHATKNKILFSVDMKSGHVGATGRNAEIKEIAKEYAFYLHSLSLINLKKI